MDLRARTLVGFVSGLLCWGGWACWPTLIQAANESQTLVIDPGHGGRDPGLQTEKGQLEKDLTLLLAKDLQRLLAQSNPSWSVYLTRDNDDTLSALERTTQATRKPTTLFISLHLALSQGDAPEEVRVYTHQFMQDDELTRLLSQAMGGDFKFHAWDLSQNALLPQSRRLGRRLLASWGKSFKLNLHEKEPTPMPITVLSGLRCPGVLIELPSVERHPRMGWQKDTDRLAFAQALVQGLRDFAGGAK